MIASVKAAVFILLASACGAPAGASRAVASPEIVVVSPAIETIELADLRSRRLARAAECVAESLSSLRDAAPGFHPLDPEDPSSPGMGRSYEIEAVSLGRATVAAALDELLMNVFQPDPIDFVFYKRVDRMSAHRADAIDEALVQVRAEMSPAEQAAVHSLAVRVEGCVDATITVYELEAGFSDAVGTARHGVALVDEQFDEALWLYSVAAWSS
jgi:hypothetical protein